MAKQIVVAEGSSPPIGPYSLGVWAGDLLFVSGQTPIDPATGTVASDSVEIGRASCRERV